MNALDVPALPLLVTVMVLLLRLLVMVTFPCHCPPLKFPVAVGVNVPVRSVNEAVPVKLVTRLLDASSARMEIVNGAPATWFPIVVKTK